MKKIISIAILILLVSFTLSGCKTSQQTDDAISTSQNATTEGMFSNEANVSTSETLAAEDTLPANVANNPDAPISVEDAWYEIWSDEYYELYVFVRNCTNSKLLGIGVYIDILNDAGDIISSEYASFENLIDCEQACTVDTLVSRAEVGDSPFSIRISKGELVDIDEEYAEFYVDPSILFGPVREGKFAAVEADKENDEKPSVSEKESIPSAPLQCDHSWKEADCTTPKTCTKCGQTEGSPLDHTPGGWEQAEPDYSMPFIFLHKKCTVCNKILDTEIYAINSFVNDGTFLFSPKEFSKRLTGISDILKYSYDIKLGNPSGEVYGSRITKNGKAIAVVCYLTEWPDKGDSTMGVEQENDRNVSAMVASFQTKDESDVLKLLDAILISCDPTLGSQTETRNLLSSIKKASSETGSYEYNNISYFIYKKDNGYYSFLIELTG